MSRGPLQVLVVSFDDAQFTGEIEAELKRLAEAGIVRALDVLVVAKSDDGEIQVVRSGEGHDGMLGNAVLGSEAPDAWEVGRAIAPGSAAAIAVLEHQWAVPLRAAIQRAGGQSAVTEWAEPESLERLGVSLTD
jgi:Family of unknown function (DUF6325)